MKTLENMRFKKLSENALGFGYIVIVEYKFSVNDSLKTYDIIITQ